MIIKDWIVLFFDENKVSFKNLDKEYQNTLPPPSSDENEIPIPGNTNTKNNGPQQAIGWQNIP